MKRIALVLALALALMPMAALADIQRGDRGEEVRELQTLLLETGWLFEEPDGIFGKNTEAALIKYQTFMGLTANGRADDTVMQLLRQSWSDLHGSAYHDDPAYTPNPAANGCKLRIDADGTVIMDFCPVHVEMLAQEDELLAAGTPEAAREACALWEAEIERIYGCWLDTTDTENKLSVMSAYGAWKTAAQKQREALEAAYPDDALSVEIQMAAVLRAKILMLCSFGVEYGASD